MYLITKYGQNISEFQTNLCGWMAGWMDGLTSIYLFNNSINDHGETIWDKWLTKNKRFHSFSFYFIPFSKCWGRNYKCGIQIIQDLYLKYWGISVTTTERYFLFNYIVTQQQPARVAGVMIKKREWAAPPWQSAWQAFDSEVCLVLKDPRLLLNLTIRL